MRFRFKIRPSRPYTKRFFRFDPTSLNRNSTVKLITSLVSPPLPSLSSLLPSISASFPIPHPCQSQAMTLSHRRTSSSPEQILRSIRHTHKSLRRTWCSLPLHVVDLILNRLPVRDLTTLYRAFSFALGAPDCIRNHFFSIMTQRQEQNALLLRALPSDDIMALEHHFSIYVKASEVVHNAFIQTPPSVMLILEKQFVQYDMLNPMINFFQRMTALTLNTLSDELVSFIRMELPALQILDVHPFVSFLPPCTSLPLSLGSCTKLRELDLSGNSICDVTESILGLHNLTVLDLSDNNVHSLPDDIGIRLSKLVYISIAGCPLDEIPSSLLRTIHRNCSKSWNEVGQGDMDTGLIVSEEDEMQFSEEYLWKLIEDHCPGFPHVVRDRWGMRRPNM